MAYFNPTTYAKCKTCALCRFEDDGENDAYYVCVQGFDINWKTGEIPPCKNEYFVPWRKL